MGEYDLLLNIKYTRDSAGSVCVGVGVAVCECVRMCLCGKKDQAKNSD